MEIKHGHKKIINDVPNSKSVCILAHGAGAGMDTDFMNHIAEGLAQQGVRVVRFEFPYMTNLEKSEKNEHQIPRKHSRNIF